MPFCLHYDTSYQINPPARTLIMRRLILATTLAAALAAAPALAGQSFAQYVDENAGSLSVIATSASPYVYKDSEGYTVVVGEIENMNALSPMSGIVIRATFYDRLGEEVVETVRGGPVLDVVPAGGASPYAISSASPNPEIGLASVEVEAFNSSAAKLDGLEISIDEISNDGEVSLAGSLRNAGSAPSNGTTVYLAFYDVFQPPRLLHVESIPAGDIPVGGTSEFSFSGSPNPKAVEIRAFAESDILLSGSAGADIPAHEAVTSMVTISSLRVTDAGGNGISNIPSGTAATVGSELLFQTVADDRIQEFVYYVQVKRSGSVPYVEFLGTATGSFYGSTGEGASVEWTPSEPGLYFIETFVWDYDAVPIASKGPVSIVLVS